jgi:hypothetical protein
MQDDSGVVMQDLLNRTDVQAPIHHCRCGWTSWVKEYDLAYHANAHKCNLAKKDLKK